MQKEIVVNSTPNEIRIGIVEDHELVEFLTESADTTRMVGNLYKGRVTAVRPGLQAAFVDIGSDKAGFLHVSDLLHEDPDDDDGRRGGRRSRGREGMRPIERMLREGDEILVQVAKEAIGTKGPRLTADVSLPGRFLVLMPKGTHVGVSRKIADRRERGRLKEMLSKVRAEEGAFIIRTAGEGIDEKMLRQDVEYLTETWAAVREQMEIVQAPGVVHEDVGLITGLIRDVLTEDVDAVHLDNAQDYEQLKRYVKKFSPELLDRIKLYKGEQHIFDKFDIENELKKSLERKVWLKKGGYIVIDQTEALVAIDVNTGRFTGKRNQEETIFKANMMAAREVPRQLRLRDIGGIVVIDFIDMESEGNKRKVLNELRTYLKRDRARTKTFAVSDLGLVEMSRQRVRESLQNRLSDDCPFCKGTGHVLSLDTLANKVERLLSKTGLVTQEAAIQVQANPSLAIHLLTERGAAIEKIARDFNMKIDILDDARVHREEFKIVSMRNRKDLTSQLENAVWKGTGTRRRPAPAKAEVTASSEHSRTRGRRGGESEERPRRESPRVGRGDSSRGREDRGSRRAQDGRRGGGSRRSGGRSEDARQEPRRDSRPRSQPSPRDRDEGSRSQGASPGSVAPPSVTEDQDAGTRKRRRRRGRRGRGRGKGAKPAETQAQETRGEETRGQEERSREQHAEAAQQYASQQAQAGESSSRSRRSSEDRPKRTRPSSRDASPSPKEPDGAERAAEGRRGREDAEDERSPSRRRRRGSRGGSSRTRTEETRRSPASEEERRSADTRSEEPAREEERSRESRSADSRSAETRPAEDQTAETEDTDSRSRKGRRPRRERTTPRSAQPAPEKDSRPAPEKDSRAATDTSEAETRASTRPETEESKGTDGEDKKSAPRRRRRARRVVRGRS